MDLSKQSELQQSVPTAIISFREALERESDRGCALFASSYIDDALAQLLKASLVSKKSIDQDLLTGTAPLSTFSSRISMCFYLGKISADCRRDLDILRKIRNKFAHHSEPISFSKPDIASRCKDLRFSLREKNATPRAHFTSALCAILALIHKANEESTAPVSPEAILPDQSLKIKIENQVNQTNKEDK